jgi:hypothetical protein
VLDEGECGWRVRLRADGPLAAELSVAAVPMARPRAAQRPALITVHYTSARLCLRPHSAVYAHSQQSLHCLGVHGTNCEAD